jgi:hypothetical protein
LNIVQGTSYPPPPLNDKSSTHDVVCLDLSVVVVLLVLGSTYVGERPGCMCAHVCVSLVVGLGSFSLVGEGFTPAHQFTLLQKGTWCENLFLINQLCMVHVGPCAHTSSILGEIISPLDWLPVHIPQPAANLLFACVPPPPPRTLLS